MAALADILAIAVLAEAEKLAPVSTLAGVMEPPDVVAVELRASLV